MNKPDESGNGCVVIPYFLWKRLQSLKYAKKISNYQTAPAIFSIHQTKHLVPFEKNEEEMAACKQKSGLGDYLQERGKILTNHNQTTKFLVSLCGDLLLGRFFFSNEKFQRPLHIKSSNELSSASTFQGRKLIIASLGRNTNFHPMKKFHPPKTAPSELVGFHSPTYLPRFLTSQVLDVLLVFCCWKKAGSGVWSMVQKFSEGVEGMVEEKTTEIRQTHIFFPFEYYIKTWQATKYHKRSWS